MDWRRAAERPLRQGEDHQLIGRDYRHVLLPVPRLVGDRVGVADGLELRDPELLAGLRIERAETAVVGRTDKHQSAGRDRRTGAAAAADVLLPWRQVLVDPERRLPRDLAGVGVDGDQPTMEDADTEARC